jgi:hypothetical protein
MVADRCRTARRARTTQPPSTRSSAFVRARALRALEAALDPDGLSTTARAVLARITGGR